MLKQNSLGFPPLLDNPLPFAIESVRTKTHQLGNSKMLTSHQGQTIFIKVLEVVVSVPTWTFEVLKYLLLGTKNLFLRLTSSPIIQFCVCLDYLHFFELVCFRSHWFMYCSLCLTVYGKRYLVDKIIQIQFSYHFSEE